MSGYPIHTLRDLIGSADVTASPDGWHYMRAVPMPYEGQRLRAAWAVFTGRAYAVRWPGLGEFEKAVGVKDFPTRGKTETRA